MKSLVPSPTIQMYFIHPCSWKFSIESESIADRNGREAAEVTTGERFANTNKEHVFAIIPVPIIRTVDPKGTENKKETNGWTEATVMNYD